MAPLLKRFSSPGKGNGVRATARISRGELVTSAEPLASCVSNKLCRVVCHHCFTRCETLLRCSQCKMARYCNTTCQKQAWLVHKKECTCLQGVFPRIPTDSVRLAARLIFALSSPSQSSTEELYTLEEHVSHLDSMSEEKREGLSHLVSMLELYLEQEEQKLKQEMTSVLPSSCGDALSLMAKVTINIQWLKAIYESVPLKDVLSLHSGQVIVKVTCNCFTISDGELQELGVGLYPSLSLLNHDCRPNCVTVFEGTKLQLRAVRDINSGEELTISYIETLLLTEDRQKQLEDQYHFTCSCQQCESQEKDTLFLSGEKATWLLLKEAVPTLEGLKAESNWHTLLERCHHLLAVVAAQVPDENLYKLRITDMALDASVHLQQWKEALRYGEKTLPVYRQYFPDPHPVHGVQLMRVAKLQHYLERTVEALDTFRQAYDVIKVTHGDSHSLTTDLKIKMEECRCEMDVNASSNRY